MNMKLVAASILIAGTVSAQEITPCTEDTQTCKNYNQLIQDYEDVLDATELTDQYLLMCLMGVDEYYSYDNTQALGTAKKRAPIATCVRANKRQNKKLKKALKLCGRKCKKV